MAYIDYSRHKLFYEIEGQGNNSLIFIHGLCGNHTVWSKNIPAFNEKHRIVGIDMFGHGNSSSDITPKAAFEAMPAIIEKIMEKEGLQNVVLIGHSIAGNILCSCIERGIKNVNGYVFVDCTFNANEAVVDSRNRLADSIINYPEDRLNSAIAGWYKTMMDMNAPLEDNKLILSALKSLNGRWALEFLKFTNFVRKVPKTNLPMLIFESNWLTKDQPERSFHRVLPQADYCHWDVSNHFFFVYEAQKFNRRLQEFLERVYHEY